VGGVLGELGDLDGAVTAFRRATTLKPELAAAHCGLGSVLTMQNDLDGAIAPFRRALTLDPDFVLAHLNLGHALSRKGDRGRAIAAWRRAHALKPDANVRHLIESEQGRAHADRREWQQAVACYVRAKEVDPKEDDSNFWFEYAAVLLLSGDEAGYRKTCAALLQRCGKTPGLRAYHVGRACTLAPGASEAERAGRLAQWELKRRGTEVWSLTEQAALQHRGGRLAQALPLLEQSLKVNSKHGNAVLNWLWLALTYHRLGKTQEARTWLEKATKWLDSFREGMPARAEQELELHLHAWLEAHVLRREAEALLEGPSRRAR
jgi:tetratricopeptide (TPR) repeat protein